MPAWFLPIIISAVALGIYDLCKKHAVRDNSVMPVLFFATLCGSVFFVTGVALRGDFSVYAACDLHTWILILCKSLLVSSSWTCVYYALRELPISLAGPVRATSPLWTVFGSMLLFHEIPTLWQALSMFAIFIGYYLFSVIGKLEGFSLRRHRGMHLILLGTLLGACSALYDKYLLGTLQIPRGTVQLWFSIDLVLVLGIAYAARRMFFGHRRPFFWRWSIPATGILLIIADYAYFYAVSLPDVQISVLSLVRRCNCVISFLAGIYLFRETHLLYKGAALLLILLGVAGLALLH